MTLQLDRIERLLERIAAAIEAQGAPKRKRSAVVTTEVSPGVEVWRAYALEYRRRYGVDPVRNAIANSLCAQLAKRLGAEAAPVAAFYVERHSERLYLSARHALQLLVRDAEKVHTDWKRGVAPTTKECGNAESLAYARDQMERIAKGEL